MFNPAKPKPNKPCYAHSIKGYLLTMKLTQYSDYSLRTLIYLGAKNDSATISEIAERYQISRNHVVKVVHHLGQLNYITTVRGKGGGLHLARPPSDINIGEVVRHTEGLDIVECMGPNNTCILSPTCELNSAINAALTAFISVLEGYTLEHLINPPNQLQRQSLLQALSLEQR